MNVLDTIGESNRDHENEKRVVTESKVQDRWKRQGG